MWVRRLKGREVGRILRKNGIVGVVHFVWAKTAQTGWRGGSSEQILMCIGGRCSQLSSSQARLPWPGHFPWWVIWQWALISSEEKPPHDYYLPIVTLYLECRICAPGPAPPRGFRWAFCPTATALHASLWLHPGPLAEAGCNVSKWASSSCLSAVVSKADRNNLCDLPSLACLKTMTQLPLWGR